MIETKSYLNEENLIKALDTFINDETKNIFQDGKRKLRIVKNLKEEDISLFSRKRNEITYFFCFV